MLVGSCGARSGRSSSAPAGNRRPARRSRRRPCRGGRIRARQAPAADPQSVANTVAQSASRRSCGRRPVCGLHAPGPVDPFRDRLQTGHAVEPSSSADSAEISPAVLVEAADEAGPQRAQPGRHRRRRRHETAEPELGVSPWSLDLFRCESAILHTHWVLVVMDQCTRRIVGLQTESH
jgi:hypothetical protein